MPEPCRPIRAEEARGSGHQVGSAAGDAMIEPGVTRRLIERFTSQPGPGRKPLELTRITDRKARCSGWWASACPMPTSPPPCTSPWAPPRRTCPGCCQSGRHEPGAARHHRVPGWPARHVWQPSRPPDIRSAGHRTPPAVIVNSVVSAMSIMYVSCDSVPPLKNSRITHTDSACRLHMQLVGADRVHISQFCDQADPPGGGVVNMPRCHLVAVRGLGIFWRCRRAGTALAASARK